MPEITVIGLTGQSGAGKSTVSGIIRSFGIPVIDCDKISHKVSDFPEFLSEMSEAFPECVDESGLMRKKLGTIVFNDHERLREYGRIIFPYIRSEIFRKIGEYEAKGEKLVVLDAPTLFESGMDSVCKAVISVVAPLDIKLKRVLERDGIPVEFAKSRLSSQFSEKYFFDRSDWVIENTGDLDSLSEKVTELVLKIRERFDV